jgi:hypothetical protein
MARSVQQGMSMWNSRPITGQCCRRPVKRVRQLRLVAIEHEAVWGQVSTPALVCRRCLREWKAGRALTFRVDDVGRVSLHPTEGEG